MRAFAELWDEITAERYGIADPKQRLFRYGVQVNSLGLTEQQPENNVYRILIEMLAVTLSKNARARAVQLPAWNEALGLPRPWDQQWSLRMQQILAYETDLLEYGDIFDGSAEIAAQGRGAQARGARRTRRYRRPGRRRRRGRGGLHEAAAGRIQHAPHRRHRARRAGRRRRQPLRRDRSLAARQRATTRSSPCRTRWRAEADRASRRLARRARRRGGRRGAGRTCSAPRTKAATSCRPRSPAPRRASPPANGAWPCARCSASTARRPASRRRRATTHSGLDDSPPRGRPGVAQARPPPEFLVGKPGLDGHSNGAEQIASRARDVGMDVIYDGIRLTPAEIVETARGSQVARHRPVDPLRLARAAGRGGGHPHAPGGARTRRSWSAASFRRRTRRR